MLAAEPACAWGAKLRKEPTMDDQKMDRRKFLIKSASAAIGAPFAAGILFSCGQPQSKTTPPRTVTLDVSQPSNAALATINGGVKITVSGEQQPVMVTRVSQTQVAAFSTKCTHLGCEVGLPSASGLITCPCHGSTYSIEGHVLGGPAQSNLPVYAATLSGTIITITL